MHSAEENLPNATSAGARRPVGFVAGLLLAVSIGIFLRLYLLPSQILVDDEWHGMNFAAGINAFWPLLKIAPLKDATCVPLNVYDYLLLKTVGWSEILLRLPSIVAGILSLLFFPVMVRRWVNRRTALIFAFLLAISPFLIFYSRVARPYSVVLLLSFVSFWALYSWATEGKHRFAIVYAASATLAVAFHLFAVVGALAPLGYLLIWRIWPRETEKREEFPKAPRLTAVIVTGALIVSVAAGLSILGLHSTPVEEIVAKDRLTLQSLTGFFSLLSGTAQPIWMIFYAGLLLLGMIILVRNNPLVGGMFISTASGYLIALYLLRPSSVHAAIVIARYVILLFPLSFLAVAAGLDGLMNYAESTRPTRTLRLVPIATCLAGIAFVATLAVNGPLPTLYSYPNNFTNHAAFQESYRPLSWEQSYTADAQNSFASVRREDIPEFYRQLTSDAATSIIECPMPFVNQFNLYYFYQHFHRKNVIIGYFAELQKTNHLIWVDQALSLVPELRQLHFRNMVDLENTEAIKRSGAKYIVIHTDLLPGEWTPNFNFPAQQYSEFTSALREHFIATFGLPIFWNEKIIVFEITPTSP